MVKLSQGEIDRRMVDWYNWSKENPLLREEVRKLKAENKQLRADLARERKEREESVEALKLQIEELREMVFGRKHGKDDDDKDMPKDRSSDDEKPQHTKPRSNASYRRPTPKKEEVTEEKRYGIESCPDCGSQLQQLREAVRYVEDIVIPALGGLKIVEQHTIETGFCPRCRKWRSAIPIQKQVSGLGENVRMRISYCITILGQSHEKTAQDLRDTFGITVSEGEMTEILTVEAMKLLPEYHDIGIRIDEDPCRHGDETSWPVQKEGEGQHAWVKTASKTMDAIFRLGRSRGIGNAKELFPGDQPTVTDDYGAYDHLENHGLCWAHPKRKFQDLAESTTLSAKRKHHCQQFYTSFRTLFRRVTAVHETPYDRTVRMKEAEAFHQEIADLCTPNSIDPKKLATLKATFLEKTAQYLFCIREPQIPMTNNKAERSIRPLVIKRKISFGSKTQKGADVMSILLSVCLSLWWKKPKNFYEAYRAILQKWKVV